VSTAPGDTAVQLPWLAPGVAPLVALTRPHRPDSWPTIRSDAAALLLLLRNSQPDQPPNLFQPLDSPLAALRLAHDFLGQPPAGVLDHSQPAVQTVLTACRSCAGFAQILAERTGRVDPDCAAAAALLAPLGWLAVAAVRSDAVAACLGDEGHAANPDGIQQHHFGTTAAEIARRLARRWELPAWLSTVVGYLDLPARLSMTFGGDPTLTTIVQAAVGLAARSGSNPLCLATGTPVEEALAQLGLDTDAAVYRANPGRHAGGDSTDTPGLTGGVRQDSDPYAGPLLRDLLELAAENAGRRELHLVPRLESEIDHLHRLLLGQRTGEGTRLKAQKLAGLAEFAAGAGHEINNPLAVISGQAQYLLGVEADPERQKALRTVVQQAQRIHQILTDLMQFAKPSRPQKQPVDVREVAHEASAALAEFAAQRQVRVEVLAPDESCVTDADPKQLSTALACLLRNAIEAAPTEGWARLRVEVTATDRLRIAIEDSGPGPASTNSEHLFDPFFSGRAAGRGRGLGLPTAWRLARENGGDVIFEPLPAGPTRFVMTLPRIAELPITQPLAA
jgi:signal transduction histidine kinase